MQSIACLNKKNGCSPEFTVFLNKICSWIYYEDHEDYVDESGSDSEGASSDEESEQ